MNVKADFKIAINVMSVSLRENVGVTVNGDALDYN